ncbi:hypothetical protein [Actinomadura chokoriensis]|uniref:Transposase n=1 Tax=Actinomadura chokoriensis TaxID=454156 RepID=A0ABV4QU61_9ACTN
MTTASERSFGTLREHRKFNCVGDVTWVRENQRGLDRYGVAS